MSSLLPKPAPDGIETVESFGDRAVERWQGMPSAGRAGTRPHQPTVCPCFTCSDGRDLLGMTPFKPSPRAFFEGVRTW